MTYARGFKFQYTLIAWNYEMHYVVASKYLRIHYKHFCKHVYLLYLHSGFVDHIVDWTVWNSKILKIVIFVEIAIFLATIIFTVEYTV